MNAPHTMKTCFHCGLPLPAAAHWTAVIDGMARPMCCPGCQAVAQAIADHHFDDYYRTRTVFSASAERPELSARIPSELKLYDALEVVNQYARGTEICEANFSVEGIRCAACVWLIEKRLRRIPGLVRAEMNVATERLYVRWTKETCKLSDILSALHQIGYTAYPFDVLKHGEQLRRANRTLFRQLFIAALSMMQVMMYTAPFYLAADGALEAEAATLMRWAGLLLTLPALLYSAQPFFKGAWRTLKQRALGMDVPVALGLGAAFIGSVAATVRGQGDVYFDSITMFIFLLLCSRYLEQFARRKAASTLEKLHHALPASATLLVDYPACRTATTIAASALNVGDMILVKPGEALAADGVLVEGDGTLDVSLLTGESRALHPNVGDFLPGGALNAGQALVVRVAKPACESTLAALMTLVERAGQAKPQLSLWADRVAAWFVVALLLLTVLVFGFWQSVDPARAWSIAIAVLVVSCPCALSLATPTALAAVTDRLLRQGVLIMRSHVLETLHKTTHVIFDKTGTLTTGTPVLQRIVTLNTIEKEQCLQIAAALEASSAHPLSRAISTAARALSQASSNELPARALSQVAGQGLEGWVEGTHYRLGRAAFVQELAGPPLPITLTDDALTPVYLGSSSGWLARFELIDVLRSDARQVVEYFQARGKIVILLSGDHPTVAHQIGADLGICETYGAYLPDQKLAFVQALQRKGAVVAMVGDGMNDAAVLRAADVSFAMGTGAALAQAQADAVLHSGRLSAVSDAARAASQTMTIIRQNLAWAILYNAIAIPAAAFGWLNPWLTGIGMSVSSALVVLNALRLRRIPGAYPMSAVAPPLLGTPHPSPHTA